MGARGGRPARCIAIHPDGLRLILRWLASVALNRGMPCLLRERRSELSRTAPDLGGVGKHPVVEALAAFVQAGGCFGMCAWICPLRHLHTETAPANGWTRSVTSRYDFTINR